ncbi:MAG TPA: hypothetical protein VM577_17980 [Anaerovoracaceae bacterium]|nr:hypothetical protein [Anaerovoracaceae bacterium]
MDAESNRIQGHEIVDNSVEGQRVFRLLDIYCHSCGKQLNTWEERCNKALKYKNYVCESCICKEYDMTADELRDTMKEHFGMVPCQGI